MRKIELKEMQRIELDLLLALDKVCKQHHLRYYMDGGTLLGAMCYEGFIPWDDDIDLKMPRPDYEKLLTLQEAFPSHIRLDAPSAEHCEYTILKLIDDRTVLVENKDGGHKTTGVYLDVFPMDGYPLERAAWEPHLKQLSRLNTRFHQSLNGFKALRESPGIFSKIKGGLFAAVYTPWKVYQQLERLAKRFDYEQAEYVGLLMEGVPEKERFEKNWLRPGFQMEFEGYMIPAPSGYRQHMEIFYGSHVTKPECHHNLPMILPDHYHDVYWKEEL